MEQHNKTERKSFFTTQIYEPLGINQINVNYHDIYTCTHTYTHIYIYIYEDSRKKQSK